MQRDATETTEGDAATLLGALRKEAREEPESGIVEIFNYGRGRPGLIPLWVGEGDLPTPPFICEAAYRSMLAGETFYTYQRGIPELRQALAAYHERLYGRPFDAENFFVTASGMQAIQLVIQAIAGPGDEVVVPTPAWTNYPAPLRLHGVKPVCVPMQLDEGRWRLDPERLFEACNERTRAIFINTPSNPLGWVAPEEKIRAIRDFACARGLWIVADEVYARFYYGSPRKGRPLPPSFHEVCGTDEQVIWIDTFSKNWAMTGWRVGWIIAPHALGQVLENLIQYNTSGVAHFFQRACVAAIEQGESFVEQQIARARAGLDLVSGALEAAPGVSFAKPEGAFYLFFRIEGESDTAGLAKRLVDEIAVGFAPGSAFGPGGEDHLRLCFARSADSLAEAMERLGDWLRRR